MFLEQENDWYVIGAVTLCACLAFAFVQDFKWREKNPDKFGFKWGNFVIASVFFTYILPLGVFILMAARFGDLVWALILAGLGIVFLGLIVKALQRRLWANILITILSLNVLVMFINFFYLRARRYEFAQERTERIKAFENKFSDAGDITFANDSSEEARRVSKGWRLAVFGSLVWIIGVTVSAFLFQPYGRRVDDDELLHLLSVALVPVVIGFGLYWIYDRYVR